MRRWASVVAALALALPGPAAAQDPIAVPSPILTIDQDRLFEETRLGQHSTREIDAAAEALTDENRRIEEDLRAEEISLTERRGSMSAEEFAGLADAFDAKVQAIRAEQDAKARALASRQEEARQAFFVEVAEILSEIVREEGAVVILDRRDVFLSADRIDITDQAIARINAAGRQTPAAPAPATPAPDPVPDPVPPPADQ
ncbi:OmpH family outer membrane protein [Palleronia sp. KMU-117]|uniref:OmpH family outer membrane protein n=1 Tax=Palleronia sp. KMU-117 TaxID=3434108 RepID=UPI003D765C77